MLYKIFKKRFSSKLYKNVRYSQNRKVLSLQSQETLDISQSNKEIKQKSELYSKVFNIQKKNYEILNSENKKLIYFKNVIDFVIKNTNVIDHDGYNPKDSILTKEEEFVLDEIDYVNQIFGEYLLTNIEINEIKSKINECEEILNMTSDQKQSTNTENIESKSLITDDKNKRIPFDSKKETITNGHLSEMYYKYMPFANMLLSPYKYKDPFLSEGKDNYKLIEEYENEVGYLNEEIKKTLIDKVEKEMKTFKLSEIKSDKSLFNDPIKEISQIGYFIEESDRKVDYDVGMELERLYYIINTEDDFGTTMQKEESENKKPKEIITREGKQDMIKMRNHPYFPFVIDGKTYSLMSSLTKL